ncbi:hypothetical protein [Dyella tabacisoli]|uniref:Uncharacterized protein n=1 Tax=Dyella tabacisoli TaxID=2282381 RepID=A0A369USX1_9GAMM|nr:hypothetical protein [Dyella tabacisoli]RDD83577.1 hypothetical protein DVJ77_03090 [Dyella tabacisoli]
MPADSNLKVDFYSKDPSEIQEYLGKIYADNAFQVGGKQKYVKTRIRFLSESTRESFLIISCTGGSAVYSRDDLSAACSPGVIVPISATGNSLRIGGHAFAAASYSDKIAGICHFVAA